MNTIYYIWASDKDKAYTISKQLCISIQSMKQNFPDHPIHIYMANYDLFDKIIPFLKTKSTVHPISLPWIQRDDLFNKVFLFLKAIENHNSFISLDCDTIVRKIEPRFNEFNQNLCFSCYRTHRLQLTTKKQHSDLKKYFGVTRQLKYVCSRLIYVNQTNKYFWSKYRIQLEKIINTYSTIIKTNPSFNAGTDEKYFTLALLEMGENPIQYTAPDYRYVSEFIDHGPRVKKSEKYRKCIKLLSNDKDIGFLFK